MCHLCLGVHPLLYRPWMQAATAAHLLLLRPWRRAGGRCRRPSAHRAGSWEEEAGEWGGASGWVKAGAWLDLAATCLQPRASTIFTGPSSFKTQQVRPRLIQQGSSCTSGALISLGSTTPNKGAPQQGPHPMHFWTSAGEGSVRAPPGKAAVTASFMRFRQMDR